MIPEFLSLKRLSLAVLAIMLGMVGVGTALYIIGGTVPVAADAAPTYTQIDMNDYYPIGASTPPYTITMACYRLEFGEHYTSEAEYVGTTRWRTTGPFTMCTGFAGSDTDWYRIDFDKDDMWSYPAGGLIEIGDPIADCAWYISAWDDTFDSWGDSGNSIAWSCGWMGGWYTATLDSNNPLETGGPGDFTDCRIYVAGGDDLQVNSIRYLRATNDTSCTGCQQADWASGRQHWYYDWYHNLYGGGLGEDYCEVRTGGHETNDSYFVFHVGEMTIGPYTGDVVLLHWEEKILTDGSSLGWQPYDETWYLMKNYGLVRVEQYVPVFDEGMGSISNMNPRTVCIISETIDYGS